MNRSIRRLSVMCSPLFAIPQLAFAAPSVTSFWTFLREFLPLEARGTRNGRTNSARRLAFFVNLRISKSKPNEKREFISGQFL